MSSPNPGWVPDTPDSRDKIFQDTLYKSLASLLPTTTSSTLEAPKIKSYHQQNLGSCTANAVALAVRYSLVLHTRKTSLEGFQPCRLWIWYWGKWYGAEDDQKGGGAIAVTLNGGSGIRDSIKTLYKKGCPAESAWAYPNDEVKLTEGPDDSEILPTNIAAIPFNALKAANWEYATFNLEYFRIKVTEENGTAPHKDKTQDPASSEVSRIEQIKHCVAEGYPVVFGIYIYQKRVKNPTTKKDDWVDTWSPVAHEAIDGDTKGHQILRNPPKKPAGISKVGHAMVVVSFDNGIKNTSSDGKPLQTTGAFEVQNSWGPDNLERYWIPYEYFTGKTWVWDIWVIKVKGFENDPHGQGSHSK